MSVQTHKHLRRSGRCCRSLERLFDPRLFRALSDPTRLRILIRLAECAGPCSVTTATDCCDVDFSVVSRHLSVLHDAGILEARKQGRTVHYTVRYSALSRALRSLADAVDACCPDGACGSIARGGRRSRSGSRAMRTDVRRTDRPSDCQCAASAPAIRAAARSAKRPAAKSQSNGGKANKGDKDVTQH